MKRRLSIIFIFSLFFLLTSCNILKVQSCGTFYALDTTISVTFYNTDDVDKYYKEIKEIYYKVDRLSSDYTEYENNVYVLNKNREIEADSMLIDLIDYANSSIELTNGYFNPYIGKLTHLWKESLNNNTIPEDAKIKEYLKEMNETSIEITGNRVKLIGDGDLDLGGIAKGYSCYLVQKYLEENGITKYLINAGQSNVMLGSKNGASFKIGFKRPLGSGNYYLFEGKNICIGTSSNEYQHKIINDVMYHHILSPFTGYPMNYYDSVNVIDNNSLECDLFSTALYSMPIEEAKSFIALNNIDAIIFKDEILYQSEGIL